MTSRVRRFCELTAGGGHGVSLRARYTAVGIARYLVLEGLEIADAGGNAPVVDSARTAEASSGVPV